MDVFDRLKAGAAREWRAYTEHPFTDALADGSLPPGAFRAYLAQDYLFLIEFARAYALAIYKAPTLADMRESANALAAILDVEMDLHVGLCARWGLSAADLEQTPAEAATLAYTRYVLDAGMRGDLLSLKVALAPCVIGYAEIARRLTGHPRAAAADNPYRAWIAEYAGAPFQEVARAARAHLDRLADAYLTPRREGDLITASSGKPRVSKPLSGTWPGWNMAWLGHGIADGRSIRIGRDLDEVAVGIAAVDGADRAARALLAHRTLLDRHPAGGEVGDHRLGVAAREEAEIVAAGGGVETGEPFNRIGADRAQVDLLVPEGDRRATRLAGARLEVLPRDAQGRLVPGGAGLDVADVDHDVVEGVDEKGHG